MRKIFSMFCVMGLILCSISAMPANAEEPEKTCTEATEERYTGLITGYNLSVSNYTVTVSGYPYDPSNGMDGYQYKSTGTISNCTTYQYNYTNETKGGHSGSPVYDADFDVIAIHGASHTGVRITSGLYDYIVSKINATEN